ncbi:hypothetical protein V1478_015462 [Vespula squamosa]|uniref:Uncharacterized protein n=1 Tax=Vespula squamosa TaxID=30214 RepID=A0ABD2A565_VESSQ
MPLPPETSVALSRKLNGSEGYKMEERTKETRSTAQTDYGRERLLDVLEQTPRRFTSASESSESARRDGGPAVGPARSRDAIK